LNDQAEDLLSTYASKRGPAQEKWVKVRAFHRIMAKWNGDFFRAFDSFYGQCILTDRPGGLDGRTRELIILAGAALIQDTPGLHTHARKAIELYGCSVEECFDAVATAAIIGGIPTLRVAIEIIAEEAAYLDQEELGIVRPWVYQPGVP
jgi:alkylhydroperoxidase/carboxymuconolactone decarboxylase family protein YurZ